MSIVVRSWLNLSACQFISFQHMPLSPTLVGGGRGGMSVEEAVRKVVMACLRGLAGVLARAFIGVFWPRATHTTRSVPKYSSVPPNPPGNVQDVTPPLARNFFYA